MQRTKRKLLVKELAAALGKCRNYVGAMRRLGFVGETQEQAREWLKDHPSPWYAVNKPHLYSARTRLKENRFAQVLHSEFAKQIPKSDVPQVVG